MEFLNHSSIKYFCLWVRSIGWRLNILSNNESNRIKSGLVLVGTSSLWRQSQSRIPTLFKPFLILKIHENPRINQISMIKTGSWSNLEILMQKSDTLNVEPNRIDARVINKSSTAVRWILPHVSKFIWNKKQPLKRCTCPFNQILGPKCPTFNKAEVSLSCIWKF